jgi:hypothetical protein
MGKNKKKNLSNKSWKRSDKIAVASIIVNVLLELLRLFFK